MPCFHPLQAWKTEDGIKFYNPYKDNRNHKGIKIPCRQCTGCRSEYSRQWAMRNVHEAQLHDRNVFITLTYDDEHLPKNGTLVKDHFRLFMKSLRKPHKKLDWIPPKKIRFYMCGEYGEKFGRPHYHAILFNTYFPDAIPIQGKPNLFDSDILRQIWGKGHVSIGAVTFESAAYVSAYVQKKINGKQKDQHYAIYNKDTGEYFGQLQQEYANMSRKPGIAGDWLAKYKDRVYQTDDITINGRKMRPPKYYDRLYEIDHQDKMQEIKKNRKKEMDKLAHLFTPEALKQAEKTHKARMSLYKRNKL
jgi:hypothetical protein